MGLRLNEEKTGAVGVAGNPLSTRGFKRSESLPSGPISWGFLKLGLSGKWKVDNEQIDGHVNELRTQLQACTSIFAFVQAWNVYVARFIPNNFGEFANCLGRPHLEMVTETFGKLQRQLFQTDELHGGSVVAHLQTRLASQFGAEHVPDGFLYFPVHLGGLGLVNPMIPLSLVYEDSMKDPTDAIEEAFELEEIDYEKAKKAYLEGSADSGLEHKTARNDEFMTLDEYTKYREETSSHLYQAYMKLLKKPCQTKVESTPDVQPASMSWTDDIGWTDDSREAYDEWVRQLYGPEIVEKYGGLAMGAKKLLPIGLVSMLRSEKIRRQE